MRGRSSRVQISTLLAAVAAVMSITLAMIASGHLSPFFKISDVDWYVMIAKGEAGVMQPFASRQLGPLAVRAVAALLHTSIQRSFVIVGVICMLGMLGFVFRRMTQTFAPLPMLLAAILLPFWPQLFGGLALPDLWYAAILCIFLYLLTKDRMLWAAAMMFPLMVSRESTSLTLVCFLIACWRPLRWPGRLLAVFSAVAGMALVHHLARNSIGNTEHISTSAYLFAKVPWNFLRMLGVEPWSNLYPYLCTVPTWQHSVHVGTLNAVGFCNWTWLQPIQAIIAATTTFGLLPLVTAMLWFRSRRVRSENSLLRFCLIYGSLCYFLAPMLGVWYSRLFGYSWPLFLVALPLLLVRFSHSAALGQPAFRVAILLALHAALYVLAFTPPTGTAAISAIAIYAAGYMFLRQLLGAYHPPADSISSPSAHGKIA